MIETLHGEKCRNIGRAMISLSVWVISVLLFCPGNDSEAAGPWGDRHSKPQAPLLLHMTVTNTPAVGKEILLDLSVTPYIHAPDLRITVSLPEGLELVSGESTFVVAMSKGETRHFPYQFILPDSGSYEILASAAMNLPDGSSLAKAASVTVQTGQAESRKEVSPVIKRSLDHEPIIEYVGE